MNESGKWQSCAKNPLNLPICPVADGFAGKVSKGQHMFIMKHASSPCTFLNHYHPLQLDTDMIWVICGLDPDVELMRLLPSRVVGKIHGDHSI